MGAGIARSGNKIAHTLDQTGDATEGGVARRALIQAHVGVGETLLDNLHDLGDDIMDLGILQN